MVPESRQPRAVPVWGARFAPWTLGRTVDEIDALVRAGAPSYFVTANLHTLMLADAEPEMRAILDGAAFVLADGMPVLWGARLGGRRLPERVAGSDLLPALCEMAASRGYRVFFLGGSPGVADAGAERLVARFPGLQVVGTESPPFRPPTPEEEGALAGRIRAARPHLLLVLFGQPKGELWIRRHIGELGVPVCAQFGASLDFVAGRVRRAPRWVQRTGMEWLYRLAQEPLRLGGRYARNGLFLARMLTGDARRLLDPRRRRSPAPGPDPPGRADSG